MRVFNRSVVECRRRGLPSAHPTAGAYVFSLLTDSADGGAKFGEMILDVRQQCCMLQLACCQSAMVGRSVAQMQQGGTAQLVVGDPANHGALMIDCDLSQMQDGPSNGRSSANSFCSVTAHVVDPSPDAVTDGNVVELGRRMGASVALGGGVALLGILQPAARLGMMTLVRVRAVKCATRHAARRAPAALRLGNRQARVSRVFRCRHVQGGIEVR